MALGTGLHETQPEVEDDTKLQRSFAIGGSISWGITDRLSWWLPAPAFAYRFGSPDTIVEKLRFLQEEIGLSGILAELNCGGLIPHDRVLAAMHLLCEAVKPRFTA